MGCEWSAVQIGSPRLFVQPRRRRRACSVAALVARSSRSMPAAPLILVSNDDGIHSDGLRALADAVAAHGRVVVVAPDREQSAVSHALTLHRPLRIDRGRRRTATPSTARPTDCVNLAINGILRERPALVVSGINKGANLGDDVTYSGTVSAAMEGTLLGVPSIAVSLIGRGPYDFTIAAGFAGELVARVAEHAAAAGHAAQRERPAVRGRRATARRRADAHGQAALRRRHRREGRSARAEVLLDRRRGAVVRGRGGHRLPRRQPRQHLGDADPPRPHELRVVRRAPHAGRLVVARREGRRRGLRARARGDGRGAARGARHPRRPRARRHARASRGIASCRRSCSGTPTTTRRCRSASSRPSRSPTWWRS